MKNLILTVLTVISLVSARGALPEQTVERLLRNVRAELPKGWTASYDKELAWLEISRDETVFLGLTTPNQPPSLLEKRSKGRFFFAFRVVAAVQPVEHRRLSAENAKIQKEADMLYDELIKRRIDHKFDDFSPRTNEEKEAVARYEALKKSFHRLPEFYFGDISLEWGINAPDNPLIVVDDERIRDECRRIQEKIIGLLTKYEKAEERS